MKIKIGKNEVEAAIIKTYDTPAGLSYYRVEYKVDGICIHAANTGAMHGSPNPIAILDGDHTWTEYHYRDIPNPDPTPVGAGIKVGTAGGRKAWWEDKTKTHRQAISDAISQIVQ